MRNLQLSAHFNLKEFRCQKDYKDCPYCGGSIRVKNIIIYEIEIYRLETIRWLLMMYYGEEIEIIISRGDSCNMRNAEVSSCIPPELSWHFRGCAIDCFARWKASKETVPSWVLYRQARQVYEPENLQQKSDHLHITIAHL